MRGAGGSAGFSGDVRRWWPVHRLRPSEAESELLRAATSPEAEAAAAWRRWRRSVDPVAAPPAQQLLLPAALIALPHDVIEPRDRSVMLDVQRRVWAESEGLWAGFERLLDVLDTIGSQPIVVKGANPLLRLGRGPGGRAISDVDVVVAPERFGEVVDVLVACGWRAGSHIDPWSHAVTMVGPDEHLVDVHRWVIFPRYAEEPEDGWFARAAAVVERGRRFRTLDPADEAVLSIVHGLSSRGLPAARWPLDVDTIVRAATGAGNGNVEAFWTSVAASAEEVGLALQVGWGLEWCRTTLRIQVPDDVVDRLHRSVSTIDRSRAATARIRNNPPGLWTRYRRVASSRDERPRISEFARARRARLESVGVARSIVDGATRSLARLADGRVRRAGATGRVGAVGSGDVQ